MLHSCDFFFGVQSTEKELNYPIGTHLGKKGKNKTRKSALVENIEYLWQCVPDNRKLVMWDFSGKALPNKTQT